MSEENIKLNLPPNNVMALARVDPGGACRYLLEITNMRSDSNMAFKIKTTAPKIFVVKPI